MALHDINGITIPCMYLLLNLFEFSITRTFLVTMILLSVPSMHISQIGILPGSPKQGLDYRIAPKSRKNRNTPITS